jgi:malonyl-CoA/methylmalonyl-CoA synthetase
MSDNENLVALIETRLQGHASRPAFITADGSVTSFGALLDMTAHMAAALADSGVEAGDRVMVQVEKSIANVALYLATLKLGALYNPLNTAYTPRELQHFIADAEPAVIVTTAARLGELEPLGQRHGTRALLTLEADGSGTLEARAHALPPWTTTASCRADDLAALVYTSGTTGRSKGAMISHGNLSSNALTLIDLWRFQPQDVLLHALPIFHVHGLFVALNTTLLNASALLWLERFDAAQVLSVMPEATLMMGVPTFYTRLIAMPGLTRAATAHMRLFISGSAPLLAETHRAFTERTGHAILERYGMTETGMITSNPYDGARLPGSVGYALPGVSVRVCDESGRPLATGEVGIVEVKGPNVFKGYWRLPEKTAEEFRDGGWFITGDQGRLDADGRLTLVGRAKDMIISGGLNVYPIEIETEIDALAGV